MTSPAYPAPALDIYVQWLLAGQTEERESGQEAGNELPPFAELTAELKQASVHKSKGRNDKNPLKH